VCVCVHARMRAYNCIFSVFIENLFAINNCTILKSTFGIKAIIGFRGMTLWLGVWIRYVIILVTMGDILY